MPRLQKLSPARSQSSAGRSTLGSDDSATYLASHKTHHRQERQQTASKRRSPQFIVAALAVLVFITQFGASLSDVPSVRLLQEIICRRHYGLASDSSVEEEKCRTDGIQGQLNVISIGALVFGYLPGKYLLCPYITHLRKIEHRLTATISGILVALPYGTLADRRGRKPVLGLCILGMILSQLIWIAVAWNYKRWDLRNVWFSSLPLLIGGGETVAEAMVFAIVADVAPEGKR